MKTLIFFTHLPILSSVSMKEGPCTICDGGTHEAEEITMTYKGTVYEFCSSEHKREFTRMPERYI